MPPKTSTSGGTSLTDRDIKLVVNAIKSAKTPLEIDYQQFADLSGLKNGNSGKAAWHGLKKKLDVIVAAAAAAEGGKWACEV